MIAKGAEQGGNVSWQAILGEMNRIGQNNLGYMYQHGLGVPKSMEKAFEWYLASARHGNPVGQCNLATLYYRGAGIPRDYKEAARWFRAAADTLAQTPRCRGLQETALARRLLL